MALAHDVLAGLSREDRERVFEHLLPEFQKGAKKIDRYNDDEIDVLEAIQGALHISRSSRRSAALFIEQAKSVGGRNGFSEKARIFVEVVESGCHQKPSRSQRVALLRIAADCLYDYLSNIGAKLNETSMVNNARNLEQAIDQAFPGYIRARMLDRVAAVAA